MSSSPENEPESTDEKPDDLVIEGLSVKEVFSQMTGDQSRAFESSAGGEDRASPTTPNEREPRRFGQYQLIEIIAEGGTGVIWKARQTGLDRWLSIKILRAGEWVGEDSVTRFIAEAEAVSLLDHPNIAPIYDVGQVGGVPFMSLRWFSGGSLANHLARYRNKPDLTAALMVKLAHAVQHANERGILHRDLKPSNILLAEDGEPHVADFGICHNQNTDSNLTSTGSVLGSLVYLAPEMLRGGWERDRPTIDVYGLGCVLYEMLTGRPPFSGDNPVAIMQHMSLHEPVPPHTLNDQVTRDLEVICMKCLAREPRDRYPTAAALAEDLERWQNHHPIHARPSTALERTTKWVRRHPAWAALALILPATITALFVISEGHEKKLTLVQDKAAVSISALADTQSQLNELALRESLTHIDETLSNGQQQEAIATLIAHLRHSPEHSIYAMRLRDVLNRRSFALPVHNQINSEHTYYRSYIDPTGQTLLHLGFENGFRLQKVGAAPGPWQQTDAILIDARFNPEGDGFSVVTSQWQISQWSSSNQSDLRKVNTIEIQKSAVLKRSPGSRPNISLFRKHLIQSGRPPFSRGRLYAKQDNATPPGTTFSRIHVIWDDPSNQIIAWPAQTRSVSLYSGETGKSIAPQLEHQNTVLSAVSLSEAGIAFTGDVRGQVARWDTTTGKRLAVSESHGLPIIRMVASPAGDSLAAIALDRTLWIYDLKTLKPLHRSVQLGDQLNSLSYNRTGSRLAIGSFNGSIHVIDPETLAPTLAPLTSDGFVHSVAFSADADYLLAATENGHIQVWDTAGTEHDTHANRTPEPILGGTLIDPEGTFALTSHSSHLQLHTALSQEHATRKLLDRTTRLISSLAISPDGTHLLAGLNDQRSTRWIRWTLPAFQELPKSSSPFVALNAEFNAQGTHVLSSDPRGTFRSFELSSGTIHYEIPTARDTTHTLSTDSTLAAIIAPDGAPEIRATNSGQLLGRIPSGETGIKEMRFSPDHSHLYIVGNDSTIRSWTGEDWSIAAHQVNLSSPITATSIGSDSVFCGTRSGDIVHWNTREQQSTPFASRHVHAITSLAISSDEQWLASGTAQGDLLIWDIASGLPVVQNFSFGSPLIRLQFNPEDDAVIAITQDGIVRTISLSIPTQTPSNEELALIESAIGLRLDANQNPQPVSRERFLSFEQTRASDGSTSLSEWSRALLDKAE